MPTIRHPNVEGTAVIPDAVVPFWTGPAGWQLVDDNPTPPARKKRRSRRSPAPNTTPVRTGAPDDVPGQGSSTTTHTEE